MKTLLFSFILLLFVFALNAANITISISGFTYSPNSVTAKIGDNITIDASSTHPLVQVDETTWNANGTTPDASGWGVKTSAYTFTPSAVGTIYFVCQAHAGIGMKGKITVEANSSALNIDTLEVLSVSIYPNPVQNLGTLKITLPEASSISASVLNVIGVPVKVIVPNTYVMGENLYNFDVSDLPVGKYIVVITDNRKKYYYHMMVVR